MFLELLKKKHNCSWDYGWKYSRNRTGDSQWTISRTKRKLQSSVQLLCNWSLAKFIKVKLKLFEINWRLYFILFWFCKRYKVFKASRFHIFRFFLKFEFEFLKFLLRTEHLGMNFWISVLGILNMVEIESNNNRSLVPI